MGLMGFDGKVDEMVALFLTSVALAIGALFQMGRQKSPGRDRPARATITYGQQKLEV